MTLPASGQKWLDTLGTMRAAIAELAAERDHLCDVLLRHGFRRCDIPACNCDSWHHENELDIYLRCRGAQGESVLARIQRMEHDRKNVDRFWQNAQTRGDVLQQQLDQLVQEREALAKSYRETIDDRDALLRIINDAFLSLHIPGSTKAFDGRNLVVHAQDSAEVAMVLRADRDEARRERDTALAITSLPGYVRLAAERDRYRDALVARHGGEPLALLSELDAARAERDAAVAKCAGMEQERDHLRAHAYEVEAASGWKVGLAGHPTPADHIRSIVQERDAARRDLESLMAAAKSLTDDPNACWEDFLAAVDAIAAAEQGGA